VPFDERWIKIATKLLLCLFCVSPLSFLLLLVGHTTAQYSSYVWEWPQDEPGLKYMLGSPVERICNSNTLNYWMHGGLPPTSDSPRPCIVGSPLDDDNNIHESVNGPLMETCNWNYWDQRWFPECSSPYIDATAKTCPTGMFDPCNADVGHVCTTYEINLPPDTSGVIRTMCDGHEGFDAFGDVKVDLDNEMGTIALSSATVWGAFNEWAICKQQINGNSPCSDDAKWYMIDYALQAMYQHVKDEFDGIYVIVDRVTAFSIPQYTSNANWPDGPFKSGGSSKLLPLMWIPSYPDANPSYLSASALQFIHELVHTWGFYPSANFFRNQKYFTHMGLTVADKPGHLGGFSAATCGDNGQELSIYDPGTTCPDDGNGNKNLKLYCPGQACGAQYGNDGMGNLNVFEKMLTGVMTLEEVEAIDPMPHLIYCEIRDCSFANLCKEFNTATTPEGFVERIHICKDIHWITPATFYQEMRLAQEGHANAIKIHSDAFNDRPLRVPVLTIYEQEAHVPDLSTCPTDSTNPSECTDFQDQKGLMWKEYLPTVASRFDEAFDFKTTLDMSVGCLDRLGNTEEDCPISTPNDFCHTAVSLSDLTASLSNWPTGYAFADGECILSESTPTCALVCADGFITSDSGDGGAWVSCELQSDNSLRPSVFPVPAWGCRKITPCNATYGNPCRQGGDLDATCKDIDELTYECSCSISAGFQGVSGCGKAYDLVPHGIAGAFDDASTQHRLHNRLFPDFNRGFSITACVQHSHTGYLINSYLTSPDAPCAAVELFSDGRVRFHYQGNDGKTRGTSVDMALRTGFSWDAFQRIIVVVNVAESNTNEATVSFYTNSMHPGHNFHTEHIDGWGFCDNVVTGAKYGSGENSIITSGGGFVSDLTVFGWALQEGTELDSLVSSCEANIDFCTVDACNHGVCVDGVATSFSCTCDAGYYSTTEMCDSSPVCPEHSTGTSVATGCVCDSAAGYEGTITKSVAHPYYSGSCVDVVKCTPDDICGVGGTCAEHGATFECTCAAGYAGGGVEIPCSRVNCPLNSVGDSVAEGCVCAPGYHGDIVPEGQSFQGSCVEAQCANGDKLNAMATCKCNDGFGGDGTWQPSTQSYFPVCEPTNQQMSMSFKTDVVPTTDQVTKIKIQTEELMRAQVHVTVDDEAKKTVDGWVVTIRITGLTATQAAAAISQFDDVADVQQLINYAGITGLLVTSIQQAPTAMLEPSSPVVTTNYLYEGTWTSAVGPLGITEELAARSSTLDTGSYTIAMWLKQAQPTSAFIFQNLDATGQPQLQVMTYQAGGTRTLFYVIFGGAGYHWFQLYDSNLDIVDKHTLLKIQVNPDNYPNTIRLILITNDGDSWSAGKSLPSKKSIDPLQLTAEGAITTISPAGMSFMGEIHNLKVYAGDDSGNDPQPPPTPVPTPQVLIHDSITLDPDDNDDDLLLSTPITAASNVEGTDVMTVAVCIKPNKPHGQWAYHQRYMWFNGPFLTKTEKCVGMTISPQGAFLVFKTPSGDNQVPLFDTDASRIDDNRWHSVAVVVTRQQAEVYVDGVKGTTRNVPDGISTCPDGIVWVGRRTTTAQSPDGRGFSGSIANLKIMNFDPRSSTDDESLSDNPMSDMTSTEFYSCPVDSSTATPSPTTSPSPSQSAAQACVDYKLDGMRDVDGAYQVLPHGIPARPPALSACDLQDLHSACVERVNSFRAGHLPFSSGDFFEGIVLDGPRDALREQKLKNVCSSQAALGGISSVLDTACGGSCIDGNGQSLCETGTTQDTFLSLEVAEMEMHALIQKAIDRGTGNGFDALVGTHFTDMSCGIAWNQNGKMQLHMDFHGDTGTPECEPTCVACGDYDSGEQCPTRRRCECRNQVEMNLELEFLAVGLSRDISLRYDVARSLRTHLINLFEGSMSVDFRGCQPGVWTLTVQTVGVTADTMTHVDGTACDEYAIGTVESCSAQDRKCHSQGVNCLFHGVHRLQRHDGTFVPANTDDGMLGCGNQDTSLVQSFAGTPNAGSFVMDWRTGDPLLRYRIPVIEEDEGITRDHGNNVIEEIESNLHHLSANLQEGSGFSDVVSDLALYSRLVLPNDATMVLGAEVEIDKSDSNKPPVVVSGLVPQIDSGTLTFTSCVTQQQDSAGAIFGNHVPEYASRPGPSACFNLQADASTDELLLSYNQHQGGTKKTAAGSNVVLDDGRYHRVTVVVDNSHREISFYSDGHLKGTAVIDGLVSTCAGPHDTTYIGGSPTFYYPSWNYHGKKEEWTGKIKAVVMYSRALTASEVLALESTQPCPALTPTESEEGSDDDDYTGIAAGALCVTLLTGVCYGKLRQKNQTRAGVHRHIAVDLLEQGNLLGPGEQESLTTEQLVDKTKAMFIGIIKDCGHPSTAGLHDAELQEQSMHELRSLAREVHPQHPACQPLGSKRANLLQPPLDKTGSRVDVARMI